MKKVWILEKLQTPEDMEREYKYAKEMYEEAIDDKDKDVALRLLDIIGGHMINTPEGYWVGWEGKSRYKDFCYEAKDAIRRQPTFKFRVVEAEIADDAKYWVGYKITKVNDGVYRYLMATK